MQKLGLSNLETMGAAPAPQDSVLIRAPRIRELDLIRAVAITLVVILHSASPIMYQIASTPMSVWNIHNLIDSAARICVPLFFMVSGYLLLGEEKAAASSPFKEVAKRLWKLALPLLAWSIIYSVGMGYVNGRWPTLTDLFSAIHDLLQGAVVYHLWFLYELAALYLLLPLLRGLFAPTDVPARYFLALWFCLLTARLLSSLGGWGFPFNGYINLGNSGYLVAGYLIRRHLPVPTASVAFSALGLYGVVTIATFYLTKRYSVASNAYVEQFHVYATPNVVIMSISAFVFLIFLAQKMTRFSIANTVIAALSANSFGIYFIHVIFLERASYDVVGSPATGWAGAIFAIVTTAAYALAASFVAIWCLRRFRLTRWLAP